MAYCVARFYSGPANVDVEAIGTWLQKELVPSIAKIPGFQRYSGLHLKDGRLGSFSVFDSKQAAEQAAPVARDWLKSRRELAEFRLDMALQGQVGLAITGSTPATTQRAYAVARLYRTDASFDQVNAAIEEEGFSAIRAIPGLLRYTTAQLEDGRIATFNAFASEQGARAVTRTAKELRMKGGTMLSKVLPGDPEVLEGTILFTYGK
ncbi:MAG TPA: hypothetical protein DDZ81_08945 [Acetobacteraceae bacterium]|jgi:hypothetical protein|nr:hypothetical protein [Acetobacteraceae bacterium]